MPDRDCLVSTALLREHRQRVQEEIERERQWRSNDDVFFKITRRVLDAWEEAEKAAARQYVPTAEAARLTGWSEPTLRKWAAIARTGGTLTGGWDEMVARREGGEKGDWSFVVSTLPVKNTAAA